MNVLERVVYMFVTPHLLISPSPNTLLLYSHSIYTTYCYTGIHMEEYYYDQNFRNTCSNASSSWGGELSVYVCVWGGGLHVHVCVQSLGGASTQFPPTDETLYQYQTTYMYRSTTANLDIAEGSKLAFRESLYDHQRGHEVVFVNVTQNLEDL